MVRRFRWFRWLSLLLPLLLVGCPAHLSKRNRRASVMDDLDEEEDEEDEEDEEEDEDGGDARVRIRYKRLPEAVIQSSTTGRPRKSIGKLRRLVCEGREDDRVIFYKLKVSRHWHYFWLCSESKGRRASSKVGAKRVQKWLRGFKRQASSLSSGCNRGSRKPVLRGTHESGIRATAHCDGQIILRFPDGGQGVRAFSSQGGDSSSGGQSYSGGGGGSNSSDCVCPKCPTCPQVGRGCRDCPPPRTCPRCPPPKTCPRCDCSKQKLAAGRKGFGQGVRKACTRICKLIYGKCRSINPNTALCHQVSEFCAVTCTGKKAK